MSVLERPPVCMAVSHSVAAMCTYSRPPSARAGVSSTCSTPTRAQQLPHPGQERLFEQAGGAAAHPATNPTETCIPARVANSAAARPTGR